MKQILVALALFFALFNAAAPARALSCLPSPPPEEEFRKSAAVFAGTVTQVEYPGTQNFSEKNYTSFQVQKIYKGDLPKFLVVQSDALWGATFEVGKQYLVYLDNTEPYHINLCHFASTELGQAGDRIRGIEDSGVKPYVPVIPSLAPPDESYSPWDWAAGAAFLALAYVLLRHFYPPHHKRK